MKKILLIIFAIAFLIPTVVFAAHFQAGEKVYTDAVINDDAYMAGGDVRVQNDVNGDLFIGGGTIAINSKISQDLTVGGGDILINGEVGDDARIGGGNILINATIKDDLLIGGGNVIMSQSSFVGGDITFGSGNLVISNEVNGNVIGAGGVININGKINGNVTLYQVDELKLGPDAKIIGNVTYKSPKETEIKEGTVGGEIDYKKMDESAVGQKAVWLAGGILAGLSIYKLLAILVFGLLLILLYRFYTINSVQKAFKSPFKSLGVGFLILVVTPIVSIILLITVIGIPIAIVVTLSWIVFLCIAKVFASMLIGWRIIKVNAKSGFWRLFGGFALGVLIYVILGFIPVIGWLLKGLLILIGLGAMTLYYSEIVPFLRKKKML